MPPNSKYFQPICVHPTVCYLSHVLLLDHARSELLYRNSYLLDIEGNEGTITWVKLLPCGCIWICLRNVSLLSGHLEIGFNRKLLLLVLAGFNVLIFGFTNKCVLLFLYDVVILVNVIEIGLIFVFTNKSWFTNKYRKCIKK
eukprot:99474_1